MFRFFEEFDKYRVIKNLYLITKQLPFLEIFVAIFIHDSLQGI